MGSISTMHEIMNYAPVPAMKQNVKELKTLQFEASKIVTSGLKHELIARDQR